ncbi:Protein Sgt1-like protein [Aduncisulcus paluster]|uniref:Protein Sgt1-like protein n=1 Tax=Aduncisulcus paluster TaxID=2918883 RepID=A0ABQ5KT82_9EUKA|nr:Protein Sgt1-like protein [Aduncisulcus paluster]
MGKGITYDFYQTKDSVITTIYQKGLSSEDYSVEFIEPNSIHVKIHKDDIEWEKTILYGGNVDSIEVTHNAYKILVTLKKAIPSPWKTIQLFEESEPKSKPTSYPSSAKKKIDWDKFEKEAAEEEKKASKDSQDPQSFFQMIYSKADPDTQRAMKKSFVESHGTVLSTNWSDATHIIQVLVPRQESNPIISMESDKRDIKGSTQSKLPSKQGTRWMPPPPEEIEEDEHRISQRQKQILFGKKTTGYINYIRAIPKEKRMKSDPWSPNPYEKMSKRCMEGVIKAWRRNLHNYDSWTDGVMPQEYAKKRFAKNVKKQIKKKKDSHSKSKGQGIIVKPLLSISDFPRLPSHKALQYQADDVSLVSKNKTFMKKEKSWLDDDESYDEFIEEYDNDSPQEPGITISLEAPDRTTSKGKANLWTGQGEESSGKSDEDE